MAEDQVVPEAVFLAVAFQVAAELREVRVDGQLVDMLFLAGLDVDELRPLSQRLADGVGRVVDAGIDVDAVPLFAELTGQLADIDAHAAGVPGPQGAHRAAVRAEHGDSQFILTL